MRDKIFAVLQEVYARDPDDDDSYAWDVNAWLADRLETYLTDGETTWYGTKPPNRRELINQIWMNWSGGGTAEIAADKILQALDMELRDDYDL